MARTSLRFATFLAPNMLPVYQAVTRYAGAALGLPTELIVGSSLDQFERGEADFGCICGLPYVRLRRRLPPPVELLAAPVLEGERYQGRPMYFSDVIVRGDSPAQTFLDLRGRSWAYNESDSQSGYGVTRAHLVALGETDGFFGRVVAAGYHQRALRLVAAGTVDAAAIDSQVLAIELRDHPELRERVRVIAALGPSTIQPMVVASRLSASLKADLRAALVAMGDDPAARQQLAHGFVTRFVPIDDAAYDDIRAMLAASERAGFMTLR